MLVALPLLLAALVPSGFHGALRFESGRHTATVRGVARDPVSGDWITVGDDKAVRRWRDGRPAGSPLRFATGEALNGQFQCCAVARTGLLAVGDDDASGPSVWLADLAEGAASPVRRIRLADAGVITAVAFSADGRLVAAGDDKGVVRAWRAESGLPLGNSTVAAPGTMVFALAFAPSGERLAVAVGNPSPEAKEHPEASVRVLDPGKGMSLLSEIKPRLLVGALAWTGSSSLVLGGEGGAIRRWKPGEGTSRPIETGLTAQAGLAVLALASDAEGKTLVAGTNYGDLLVIGESDTRPRPIHLAGDESEVWAVGLSPDGRTALAGLGDGAVCEVDTASGKPSRTLSPPLPRVTGLRWSADGGALRWKADGQTAGFDLLRSAPSTEGTDASDDGHRQGEARVGVENDRVVVGGTKRWDRLQEAHTAYDAVFLGDDRLLIATSAGLRLHGDSGRDGVTLPLDVGNPTSLARSPDGKRVAIGSADGLVRIFPVAMDGPPIASIYLSGGEWVVWQEATGQYDSSPGGDSIFGYQVNRRDDEPASFVPAVVKEADYRQPGFLPKLLGLSAAPPPPKPAIDLSVAVTKAASFQVLGVDGQATGEGYTVKGDTARVRVRVENPDDERISLRVGHDGTPRDLGDRGLVDVPGNDPNVKTLRVSGLAPGANLVRVYAGGRPLPGAEFRIDSDQPEAEAKAPARLLVLAIGVGRYAEATIPALPSAAADAKAFVQIVRDNLSGAAEPLITPIYDADATHDGIEKGLAWLKATATAHDRVMVFMASHGEAVKGGSTYVVPYDYAIADPAKHGLAWPDVAKALAAVPCRSLVLFSDNCFSGAAVGAIAQAAPREASEAMRRLAADMAVFAACTGDQTSREYSELGHGLFTYALLKGMQGEGGGVNPTTGEVTTDNLKLAVSQTMQKWQADEKIGSPQTPVILVPTSVAIPVTHPKAPRGRA